MSVPIRVLELRSVWGTGGGPEKTLLLGAAQANRERFAITVCYLRDARDKVFGIDRAAEQQGVDYVELLERHSFDRSIWPKLRRVVREGQFDIIHAHDYKTDLLALLVAKAEGVRPIATAHGWSGTSLRERAVYYPADRRLLARYPRVIAVSPAVRDTLVAAGAREERVDVILNGVDPTMFHRDPARREDARGALGLAPDQFTIGAIGRLEAIKGMDLLIDAVARVRRDRQNVHLIVAGDGTLRPSLQASADRLMPGACRFLGHQADVVALHHALDCFVQSSDGEGTSNALLEAMAMETPIVATAVGGTAAMVRDGIDGLLVPPRDATRMAEAVERTLTDRDATAERARHARARVEAELSFEARTRKVEAIYEDLVARR